MEMKAKSKCGTSRPDLRSERGAALVSTLLISALLLTAGGMLILTTSLGATNTIATTNETQAYYGAEAGLQATLNVLHGNVPPSPLFNANPADPQNKISFSKAVTNSTSNLPGEPSSTPARLSRWLSYNYTSSGSYPDRVTLSENYSPINGIAFSIVVTDPDNTIAPAVPNRLLIQSTGYGPRGARKVLSMVISAFGLDVGLPALMTIRGHDDHTTNAVMELGNSSNRQYSGEDYAGVEPIKPSFAISNHDSAVAEAAFGKKEDSIVDPKYMILDLPGEPAPPGRGVPVPWFLRTATDARAFLAQAKALAQQRGVILSSLDGDAGTRANPQFTFVDGDAEVGDGAGLLIVTGVMKLKGGKRFDGIILVLGGGTFLRGGSDHYFYGAICVARFNETGGFLNPVVDLGSRGPKVAQFDSNAYLNAQATTRIMPVQGVVEK
jgi:hypothetical protein